ncbi:L,D-transpeptidase catalytic domain [Clostridium cavendishii DSM 21758]|uniref:L,D-transpeptidase catalytic domain n=1 Tax=Clostridium cavendishii DSM 21758 TaxID=1121302 RepID=A0A1M6ECY5_9CLOT|nr:L,D-transpeptidase [Clostridium cavendishii]SHI83178.1 L,D-transpeptidase catalytic domain [Clostridium cavendishii DSM 21758]
MKQLFTKLNKRKIIIGIGSLVIVICTSYAYSKNVKATEIKDNFSKKIGNNNYEDAIKIYNDSKDDVIVMKTLNTKADLKKTINTELLEIKEDYISEKLSFKEAIDKVNKLKNLDVVEEKYYTDVLKIIERINDFRNDYKEAVELNAKGIYNKSLDKLSNIAKEDKLYAEKALKLKDEVNDKNEKYKVEIEEAKKDLTEIVSRLGLDDLKDAISSYVPFPEIEGFVNNSDISSNNEFLIWVDIKNQKTNIFLGKKNEWKLIKRFESATGAEGKDTPTGVFKVKDRGIWFFSHKYNQGGKYWVQFMGNYLFHSLPMNMNKEVVDDTLGTPVSHGCIRLAVENSKWIYDNIPNETTIYIK